MPSNRKGILSSRSPGSRRAKGYVPVVQQKRELLLATVSVAWEQKNHRSTGRMWQGPL